MFEKNTNSTKRILILTGAGAAYPWFPKGEDPVEVTTKTITGEIIKEPFCRMIYDELQRLYAKEVNNSINFEKIINALERTFLYYRGRQGHFDSDFSALFSPKEFISNYYPLKDVQEDKDQIVADIASQISKQIELVSKLISFYDDVLKQPENEMNKSLYAFLKFIKSRNNILRSYTTNYDQMFIDVSNKHPKQISFFDGFDHKTKFFNLNKILKSNRIDCYYNLHGSIYWDSHEFRKDDYRFKLMDQPLNYTFNANRYRVKKSNPLEPFIETPIITGFNKLQRINQEPFNAFSNAFYRDCHKADVFIFIGFSFNDSHINNVLSHVDWKGKKVLIVDKSDNESYSGDKLFHYWCGNEIREIVTVYNKGFESFLENGNYQNALRKAGVNL